MWARQLAGAMASLNQLLAPLSSSPDRESCWLRHVHERAGTVDGLSLVPTLNRYVGDMSDHGVFRTNGVPYLFLSCGRWPHYHRDTDTPDRLNYEKMGRIARQVLAFAAALDGAELPQTGREQFAETLTSDIGIARRLGSGWSRCSGALWPRDELSGAEMGRLVSSLRDSASERRSSPHELGIPQRRLHDSISHWRSAHRVGAQPWMLRWDTGDRQGLSR